MFEYHRAGARSAPKACTKSGAGRRAVTKPLNVLMLTTVLSVPFAANAQSSVTLFGILDVAGIYQKTTAGHLYSVEAV